MFRIRDHVRSGRTDRVRSYVQYMYMRSRAAAGHCISKQSLLRRGVLYYRTSEITFYDVLMKQKQCGE